MSTFGWKFQPNNKIAQKDGSIFYGKVNTYFHKRNDQWKCGRKYLHHLTNLKQKLSLYMYATNQYKSTNYEHLNDKTLKGQQ